MHRAPSVAARHHLSRWRSAQRRAVLLLAVGVGVASCQSVRVMEPDPLNDGLAVEARAGHLTLRNHSPTTFHYIALEEKTSALVDLTFDPAYSPRLGPGMERRIPYVELMGYSPGAEQVRVYWWVGGSQIRHVVVPLW